MFGAFRAMANSEKAVAIGLLVVAASAFVAFERMTIEQWIDYTEFMAVTYVGGKTVQGAVEKMSRRRGAAEGGDTEGEGKG